MDEHWGRTPIDSDLAAQQDGHDVSSWNNSASNEGNQEQASGAVVHGNYDHAAVIPNFEEEEYNRAQEAASAIALAAQNNNNFGSLMPRMEDYSEALFTSPMRTPQALGVHHEYNGDEALQSASMAQPSYEEIMQSAAFNASFNAFHVGNGFAGTPRDQHRGQLGLFTREESYQPQTLTQDRGLQQSHNTSEVNFDMEANQHGDSGDEQQMHNHPPREKEQIRSRERKTPKTGGDEIPTARHRSTLQASREREHGGRTKMTGNPSIAMSNAQHVPQFASRARQRAQIPDSPWEYYDPDVPFPDELQQLSRERDDAEYYVVDGVEYLGAGKYQYFIKPDPSDPTPDRPQRVGQAPDPSDENVDILSLVSYPSGLRIRSIRDYHESMGCRARLTVGDIRRNGDRRVSHEPTLARWVGMLYNAFMNMEQIIDRPIKNGKQAQSASRIETGWYPRIEIEKVCWKIVLGCVQAQYDVPLVEYHHCTQWESNATWGGFEGRMKQIIRVCYMSKAMCKQLLDPPYWQRLVDAPSHELHTKLANKKLNDTRDIHNEIGRKALQKGLEKFELSDEDITTPTKRPRGRAARWKKTPTTKSPASARKRNQSQSTPSKSQKKSGEAKKVELDSGISDVGDSEDSLPLAKRKRFIGAVQQTQGNAAPDAIAADVPVGINNKLPTGGSNGVQSEADHVDLEGSFAQDSVHSQTPMMSVAMEDPLTGTSALDEAQTTPAELGAASNLLLLRSGSVPLGAATQSSKSSIGDSKPMDPASVARFSAAGDSVSSNAPADPPISTLPPSSDSLDGSKETAKG